MPIFYFTDFLHEVDSSNINANIDCSISSKTFIYENTDDGDEFIDKLNIFIKTDKSHNYDSYGVTTLTNGITIKLIKGNNEDVRNIVPSISPVKTIGDWGKFTDNIQILEKTPLQDYYIITWDFTSRNGSTIKFEKDDKLELLLSDDFTSLTEHIFKIEGLR